MGTISDICCYSNNKVNVEYLTLDNYFSTENMQPNRQGALQATSLPNIKQTTACKKGDVLVYHEGGCSGSAHAVLVTVGGSNAKITCHSSIQVDAAYTYMTSKPYYQWLHYPD